MHKVAQFSGSSCWPWCKHIDPSTYTSAVLGKQTIENHDRSDRVWEHPTGESQLQTPTSSRGGIPRELGPVHDQFVVMVTRISRIQASPVRGRVIISEQAVLVNDTHVQWRTHQNAASSTPSSELKVLEKLACRLLVVARGGASVVRENAPRDPGNGGHGGNVVVA